MQAAHNNDYKSPLDATAKDPPGRPLFGGKRRKKGNFSQQTQLWPDKLPHPLPLMQANQAELISLPP